MKSFEDCVDHSNNGKFDYYLKECDKLGLNSTESDSYLHRCLHMIRNRYFPDIFKIAHVTALWKRSGLKSDPLMYRPIALLPTLSKAAEAIIHNRLLGHFTENNVITERQAAYLKGDSTIQQLLYIIDIIRKSCINLV